MRLGEVERVCRLGELDPDRGGQHVNCPRCHGLMVSMRMKESATGDHVSGWRCLMCGEATDPGIEANRRGHQEPVRPRARPPGTTPGELGNLKGKRRRE